MKTLTLDAKSLIASVALLALLGMAVGVMATQAQETSVSATVTAELITISVLSGSVDYGILPTGATESTITLNPTQTQTVTNNSNVDVDLAVKSSDAVGGAAWNLAATNAATDEFTHEFAPDGTSWTAFAVDNDAYTTLGAGNIAPAGTQNLDLQIKTPTSVTDQNVEKTITVTVLATASS